MAVALSALMIFEYAPWPFPTSEIGVPQFYRRLARDSQNYAVVDVPLAVSQRYGGWQAVHGKATVIGVLARCPPQAFALAAHNSLLRALSAEAATAKRCSDSALPVATRTDAITGGLGDGEGEGEGVATSASSANIATPSPVPC